MAAVKPLEMPSLQLRVRVPERVLMRRVGDEMVMLNVERERYYGMNEVGARLMQLAESGATLAEICALLVEDFDVGRDQLEADVRRIAAKLLADGLLEKDRAQ